MNRRGFLAALALGGTGFALDPARLLWVPGAKTFFLPSGNTLVTADWVTREALRQLAHTLTFAQRVNRTYDEAWRGQTVRVRTPGRWT